MQINQANLSALFRGYRVQFMEAYQGAVPFWDQIAMRTPSSSAQELYHWLGAVPGMKQLLGEVVISNLSANKYAITNNEWEDTIAVKQADIERDTYGIYNPLMQAMGIASKEHPDELVSNLLINGFTTADYTGKNFFDSAKVQDGDPNGTTLTNKATAKLGPTSFAAARQAIKSVKNSKGRPMGLGRKLLLIVPPALEVQGRQILQADFIQQTAANSDAKAVAAVSNVNKGTAELVVWPRLAGNDNAWFLLEVGMPVKPLIVQVEKETGLQSLTNPDSDHVFKKHEFLYKAYGRYNAGYGLPQLAYGSTGAHRLARSVIRHGHTLYHDERLDRADPRQVPHRGARR